MRKLVVVAAFLGWAAAAPALACNIVPGKAPAAADCSQPTVIVSPATGAPQDLAPLIADQVQGDVSITANSQHNVIDAGAAGGVALTVTGTFTATVQVQWSNKVGGTYTAGQCYAASNSGTGGLSPNITSTGQYVCPKYGRYADITSTAYTSGTAAITPALMGQKPPFPFALATQTAADAGALTTQLPVTAVQKQFNGVTEDLERNNMQQTVQASAAQTATNASSAMVNYNARGATVFVNVTAVSGSTPTMACKVEVQEPVGANWVDLPGATTASITATGTSMLQVYPGIAAVANQSVNLPLARTWRVNCTIGGSSPSFTYSISAAYQL